MESLYVNVADGLIIAAQQRVTPQAGGLVFAHVAPNVSSLGHFQGEKKLGPPIWKGCV